MGMPSSMHSQAAKQIERLHLHEQSRSSRAAKPHIAVMAGHARISPESLAPAHRPASARSGDVVCSRCRWALSGVEAGSRNRQALLETPGKSGLETPHMRKAAVKRATKETDVTVAIDLDGQGVASISTGIGFLDHMLDLLARHSRIDITVKAAGDLHVDPHHTTEDVGIALGQAIKQALGDMRGITRYADVHVPMDEALTRVAIDLSGRPLLVFRTAFGSDKIGTFDTQLVNEWFQAFAVNAAITLHVETLYGANDHHISESCFKGLARALRAAVAIDPRGKDEVPSTKGTLGG
jgi:imidazoleglycerol-phosphate dehydratase